MCKLAYRNTSPIKLSKKSKDNKLKEIKRRAVH